LGEKNILNALTWLTFYKSKHFFTLIQHHIYLTLILPGRLTENTFSFIATTWGIVTGERRGMNEPIVSWG
jgi:hypothetical protein